MLLAPNRIFLNKLFFLYILLLFAINVKASDHHVHNSSQSKSNISLDDIYGNWFIISGNNEWILSINKKVVLYRAQTWKYKIRRKRYQYIYLDINNRAKESTFSIKFITANKIEFKENNRRAIILSKDSIFDEKKANKNIHFESPIFKSDSAIYSGFIESKENETISSGEIMLDNNISGKQEHFPIKLNHDGSFSVKIPLSYPTECFVKFSDIIFSIYLEPGKSLFNLVNTEKNNKNGLFMGPCAIVNRELKQIEAIRHFDNDTLAIISSKLNAIQYNKYLISLRTQKLNELFNFKRDNNLSEKSFKIAELGIKYRIAYQLLELAGRTNNFDISFLKELDFSYISVVSNEFFRFVTSLKTIKPIMETYYRNVLFVKLYNNIKTNNQKSREDKEFMAALADPQHLRDASEFVVLLQNKYKSIAERYLTNIEPELNSDFVLQINEIRKTYFKSYIKSNLTFLLNLMFTQDEIQYLELTSEPYRVKKLQLIEQNLSIPFFDKMIRKINMDILRINKITKSKQAYLMKDSPVTSPDSTFKEITKRYKGKVICVDFWATWCGPCLKGFEQLAPLKEKLAQENIVFIDITNNSSPIHAFKNVISGIRGEHFRLNAAEWNTVSMQFHIKAIPHFVIINRAGLMVDSDVQKSDPISLEVELTQLIKEP